MRSLVALSLVCCVVAAPLAQAQTHSTSQIPVNERPPGGMCRIWVDGLPAARQPAPTDCDAAVRNRPPNARVIFGSDFAQPDPRKVELDEKKGPAGSRGVVSPPRNVEKKPVDPKVTDKKADAKKPDVKSAPRKPVIVPTPRGG
jgi:hypothetical protein